MKASMLISIVSLAAAAVACSETKRNVPVQTTSAQMKDEATRNEMAQLQRERNEARAALAEERNARDLDRQRTMSENAQRREHDELELRVLSALERADAELQRMHDKSGKTTTTKQKKEHEKTMADVHAYKQKLHADLTSLHGDMGKPWDAFKADVDAHIGQLDQAIASFGTTDTTKAGDQKAKTGTTEQQKESQQTPKSKQPQGTQGSQPQGTQPQGTQPQGTQPQGSQPQGTQPQGTQPYGTQPHDPQQKRDQQTTPVYP